jgi:hypothetical protein
LTPQKAWVGGFAHFPKIDNNFDIVREWVYFGLRIVLRALMV